MALRAGRADFATISYGLINRDTVLQITYVIPSYLSRYSARLPLLRRHIRMARTPAVYYISAVGGSKGNRCRGQDETGRVGDGTTACRQGALGRREGPSSAGRECHSPRWNDEGSRSYVIHGHCACRAAKEGNGGWVAGDDDRDGPWGHIDVRRVGASAVHRVAWVGGRDGDRGRTRYGGGRVGYGATPGGESAPGRGEEPAHSVVETHRTGGNDLWRGSCILDFDCAGGRRGWSDYVRAAIEVDGDLPRAYLHVGRA